MANKPNSGALFKEEKKSDKHPDYKGSCLVEGEVMYIAAWVNTPKDGGNKYMSLSFTPQSEQAKYSKEGADATLKPEFETPVATPTTPAENELPF
tara:strand:- start:407 stop:691 length:285 start_codon:yes stop_codon:yes gene_type:complete